MNIRRHLLAPVFLLLTLAIGVSVTGCASMEAHQKESLLSASGFKSRVPETAKQKAIFASMKPYKMQRRTVKGQVLFAYADIKENLIYVGTQTEYDAYKKFSAQQNMAEENEIAAEENAQAMDWNGWGPWGLWY